MAAGPVLPQLALALVAARSGRDVDRAVAVEAALEPPEHRRAVGAQDEEREVDRVERPRGGCVQDAGQGGED